MFNHYRNVNTENFQPRPRFHHKGHGKDIEILFSFIPPNLHRDIAEEYEQIYLYHLNRKEFEKAYKNANIFLIEKAKEYGYKPNKSKPENIEIKKEDHSKKLEGNKRIKGAIHRVMEAQKKSRKKIIPDD